MSSDIDSRARRLGVPDRLARWRPSGDSIYLLSTFLTNFGTGVMLTIQAVFVTQNLRISPMRFGFVLTCGAALGLVSGVALGKWSDGRSLRRIVPTFGIVQAIAVAGYLVSTSILLLGLVVGLVSIAGRGGAAIRGPFIAAMVGRDRLVPYRAKVRSVANAAMAGGAAIGGLALGFTSPTAVTAAMCAVPLAYFFGATLTIWIELPHDNSLKYRSGLQGAPDSIELAAKSKPAIKNIRFMVVVGLSAILVSHVPLLAVAFPLWISERTTAPTYLISVVVLINTVGVTLIQVPVAGQVKTIRDATSACFGAGAALAVAVFFLVASSALHGWSQIAAIVIAAVLHLFGELLHSAASWALAFDLAPEDRLGEYQGVFNSGMDLSVMIGPTLFSALVAASSPIGWWIFAAVLLLAGILIHLVTPQPRNRTTESIASIE